jgi:bifunctional DNA-binding transcriptional regulator/antitoxin component of YhaV-PrlF toxin-antitoxin module
MKTISIVRNRGQLTIPEPIRRSISWIAPLSAVSITVVRPDEIVIKPHKSEVEWDKIWENIKKSRANSGKGKLSGAQFLQQDRQSH